MFNFSCNLRNKSTHIHAKIIKNYTICTRTHGSINEHICEVNLAVPVKILSVYTLAIPFLQIKKKQQ